MNRKQTIMGLLMVLTLLIQSSIASPQTTSQEPKVSKGGWSVLAKSALGLATNSVADTDEERNDIPQPPIVEPQEAIEKAKIAGTWLIRVPDAPGAPGFSALQTFHEGGTFTETSDLLGTLVEGPAHGAWTGKKNDYRLTFQLFAFDEHGLPTVRVQVRATIRLNSDSQLTATATIDIIEPDGNVIPAVATSPFTGTRVQVLPQ